MAPALELDQVSHRTAGAKPWETLSPCFDQPKALRNHSPLRVGVETVLWVYVGNRSGKRHRAILETAEESFYGSPPNFSLTKSPL